MKKHRGNGMEFRGKPKEQFLTRIKKIKRNYKTPCWEWQGAVYHEGYGQYSNRLVSRHSVGAHKAAWLLYIGPIPKGVMVLHKCDNRLCANPKHLYLGNNAMNMRDRSLRGYVHQRRLTEEKVREMRQLRQLGWSWRKLAARYVVQINAVVEATMGRSWAFIDEPIPTIKIGPGRRPGPGNE